MKRNAASERVADTDSAARQARRTVGRPRTLDVAQASLALMLNLVRLGTATTRQQLERASEHGRAVVADRLATLMEMGLVEEGDLGPATGGRAPRQIQFRSEAATVLVSVVDQTSIAVGVADLAGRLLIEHHEAAQLTQGPEAILARLVTLFSWMLEEADRPAPWAVALALPGAVEKAETAFAPVPVLHAVQSWQGYPFVERLTTQMKVPVFVRSGVQTMTMGEFRAGAGAGTAGDDMIYVKLGRSISAGLVSDRHIHRGAQGAAGMIGHARVGNEVLEAVAGADAIAREAQSAAEAGDSTYLAQALARQGEVSVVDVGHGAQLGDIFCVELLGRCGRLVGEALAPLANMLNPSMIVVGGVVSETGDSLLAGIREAVYRMSHPLVTRDLQIVRSQMGASAGLVGAAQVAREEIFEPGLLQGWIAHGSPLQHPDFVRLLQSLHQPVQPAKTIGGGP
ncbi:sugar kinase [Devosia pacifica]|uniref:Sugar kinase n=1 Tax=Devosia pacifica TaxID=1335967 RepID=A0A918VZ36_9HYPH|nr:ROK family protein [Devosia pacifica]GHA39285.1 sugar kinase [Devosia pacifica]